MAVHGKNGSVRLGGATALGKVQRWTLNETGETVDATSMGDTHGTELVGIPRWTVNMEVLFKADDAGQNLLQFGAEPDIELFPMPNEAGNPVRSGKVRIASREETVDLNDAVRVTFQMTGQGALTKAAIA